ncbi:MAG: hypothetical protein KDA69_12880, partial [Planctomycetaceae bacterium]|nr:hypothetical protein [Planctomycetaceae bacterium]
EKATWPDGSSVWLDARGMLHFQSSDHRLPEFTLVLKENDVGGWSSDGNLWGGPAFHIDAVTPLPGSAVMKNLVTPFVERLQ